MASLRVSIPISNISATSLIFNGYSETPDKLMEIEPMLSMFRKLLKNEEGATAIEYGLIASLISVAAIVAFTAVGTKLSSTMDGVSGKLQ